MQHEPASHVEDDREIEELRRHVRELRGAIVLATSHLRQGSYLSRVLHGVVRGSLRRVPDVVGRGVT